MLKNIDLLLMRKNLVVIAIDGPCASGKTTLAKKLEEKYNASCFHIDDFFIPHKLDKKQFKVNFDYIRFEKEILKNLIIGKEIRYQKYNCSTGDFENMNTIIKPLVIIEGSYSLFPLLTKYYDLKIFIDIDSKKQLSRLKLRESRLMYERFIHEFIGLENAYFKEYQIREKANILLSDGFLLNLE